jgi:spore maturation protein SpmB
MKFVNRGGTDEFQQYDAAVVYSVFIEDIKHGYVVFFSLLPHLILTPMIIHPL